MTTQSELRQREIERITFRVRSLADRLFAGNTARGFLFWAADLYLDQTENRPTEEELLANITDGSDDLELDAYYIDDSSRSIYLFQSKFRSTPGNLRLNEFTGFLDVPKRLTTPSMLAELSNERILDLAPRFRRHIVEGYELQLVYVIPIEHDQGIKS